MYECLAAERKMLLILLHFCAVLLFVKSLFGKRKKSRRWTGKAQKMCKLREMISLLRTSQLNLHKFASLIDTWQISIKRLWKQIKTSKPSSTPRKSDTFQCHYHRIFNFLMERNLRRLICERRKQQRDQKATKWKWEKVPRSIN